MDNDTIFDVNGSGSSSADTFTAKHAPGVKYYDSAALEGKAKTAAYESIQSIAPSKVGGVLSNKIPANPTSICKTTGTGRSCMAHVGMKIYLEGWDFSVIDEEIGRYFDIGLTFEINRVGAED